MENSIFESMKHIDEKGNEHWEARELQKVFEYKKWEKFIKVINNAKIACKNSNFVVKTIFSNWGKWSK